MTSTSIQWLRGSDGANMLCALDTHYTLTIDLIGRKLCKLSPNIVSSFAMTGMYYAGDVTLLKRTYMAQFVAVSPPSTDSTALVYRCTVPLSRLRTLVHKSLRMLCAVLWTITMSTDCVCVCVSMCQRMLWWRGLI
jgi:hypothetical protein